MSRVRSPVPPYYGGIVRAGGCSTRDPSEISSVVLRYKALALALFSPFRTRERVFAPRLYATAPRLNGRTAANLAVDRRNRDDTVRIYGAIRRMQL